jgi:hypothetical protein
MSAMARGRALTVLAVVLALLAVSDVLKPLRLEGAETGLVFLGRGMGANSPAAGTVRVDVPPGGFQGPNPPASGEQFVGLLYDDQKPLARVVYLEL